MQRMKPLSLYHDFLKLCGIERGPLLGLDVGAKHIGVAISDLDYKIASPVRCLERQRPEKMVDDLQNLISEHSVAALIVGIPYDLRGEGLSAIKPKEFVDYLSQTQKFGDLRYAFWDECFTSKTADLLLKPLNLQPRKTTTINNIFAAVGILQGYLDYVQGKDAVVDFVNRSR